MITKLNLCSLTFSRWKHELVDMQCIKNLPNWYLTSQINSYVCKSIFIGLEIISKMFNIIESIHLICELTYIILTDIGIEELTKTQM